MAPKKKATPAPAGSLRAALARLVEQGKNTSEPVTLGELLAVADEAEA